MARTLIDIIRLKPNDRHWEILCRTLWRDYYALYTEKYNKTPLDEEGNPIDPWIKNTISPDINHGFALGQANLIEGNRSAAFGQGLNTKSFLEILIGAYATASTGSATEWVPTDRLAALGNGTDADNRSLAFEVFKSGLLKLANALVIGDYSHGDVEAASGTIKYTAADGLFLKHLGEWLNLNKPLTITKDTLNLITALGHTHEIEGLGVQITEDTPIIKVDNGETETVIDLGYLYNESCANDPRGFVAGWGLPTNSQTNALTANAGGWLVAGGKLKETGAVNWNNPNTGATNELNFSGRGGGQRVLLGGIFQFVGFKNILSFWFTGGEEGINTFQLYNDAAWRGTNAESSNNGNSIRLIKDDSIDPGSVVIDGITYQTVKIGDQVWLASNLMAKHYANGDPITEVTDAAIWEAAADGYRCSFNNLDSNAGSSVPVLTDIKIGKTITIPAKIADIAVPDVDYSTPSTTTSIAKKAKANNWFYS